MEHEILTEREHLVLEAIVRNFILSAAPTSSRCLSKQKGFDWSPATIRNIMGDLEERGFIAQPHTSAGRVPTDSGYRYYVDRLMELTGLPGAVMDQIRSTLVAVEQCDLHLVLEAASKILSRTTHQLGVILAPRIRGGILRQMHLLDLGGGRHLLNVAIESGVVKSIMVELETELAYERLECACRILTAKFRGRPLQEICDSDETTFHDVPPYELGIIRLLVPSIRRLARENEEEQIIAEGEANVMLQPEFFNRDSIGALIEIVEEKRLLMHLFDTPDTGEKNVYVSIGGENRDGQLQSFSIIKTNYRVGSMVGSLGVIGPKRMPYPFLISTVEYTARVLGELYA